jgi:hypothetical protein
MKDYLQDIVAHTQALGFIDTVKVVGDANSTNVTALSEDRAVILDAQFKNPVPEFVGTFGMPNLGKLKTILGIEEYRADAKLEISTQKDSSGADVPCGIHFENKAGDFKNDYRFMSSETINGMLKNVKMRAVPWEVDIVPAVASITRLKYQASANSEETTFTVKTENNQLKFFFGDHSSHAGDFVFADGVTGKLGKTWAYPVGAVMSIFALSGDKNLKISSEGVLQITVDSGIATYTYKLPAHQK